MSGGHDLLAVCVLAPETIHESGHNLLAYQVRGGHYLRLGAISCDTGNWESNCNGNHYNFRKTLQLVIVIVIITIFAKVICNCNDYILNVIITSLALSIHTRAYTSTSTNIPVYISPAMLGILFSPGRKFMSLT